jgi:8-oxo-dGTP pyrophosphatase MutT (NUDIX family)
MHRHFTATAYVLHEQRVLLIYHRKFGKWLPPGGHVDPDETPPEAAVREVLEETGLHVELIPQENIWIKRWNAETLLRPWMCLLENIPASKKEPAHQHMDMIYLARPLKGELSQNPRETDGLRWFGWDDLQDLQPDQDIFAETLETLEQLLRH